MRKVMLSSAYVAVFLSCLLSLLLWPSHILGQSKAGKTKFRAVSTSEPSGYTQVGNTMLYWRNSEKIDLYGKFGSSYYGSTYSDNGYTVSMQVNDGSAQNVNCQTGCTIDSVVFSASVVQQSDLARVVYTLVNTSSDTARINLGVYADVMIGSNDRAPISRRKDQAGNTYGLTLKDGNGAQLCVLFGAGLAGVTSVSDFWFGFYNQNRDAGNIIGSYSQGSNWLEENGSYDSGMGWCWKNRLIRPGETITLSYVMGVGEVSLEPNSSFEVTPDDADGWNDLSRPHRLVLDGTYESPAGIEGRVEYSVEDTTHWEALTEMMASGSTFHDSLVAVFDTAHAVHAIYLRTVDKVGNSTMLAPITYKDISHLNVSGITDLTYTGDSLEQTSLNVDISENLYTVRYRNNINAGTAVLTMEGVFPNTIGRRDYAFVIQPQPLQGGIVLPDSVISYDGTAHRPNWSFTEDKYQNLKAGSDYSLAYSDNVLPGYGHITVTGMGNYTGAITDSFAIAKAEFRADRLLVHLPDSDITYDGYTHGATVERASEGVGAVTVTYVLEGTDSASTAEPSAPGTYSVYYEVADGDLYKGTGCTLAGTFCIYQMDASDWLRLVAVGAKLAQQGSVVIWDTSRGPAGASKLAGVQITQGHVTGLSLSADSLSGAFPVEVLSFPDIETLDLSYNSLTGGLDTLFYAATLRDSTLCKKLRVLNVSYNSLHGNIGILASCLPSLERLDVGHNRFEDAYPAVPSKVRLSAQRQNMERVVPVNVSHITLNAATMARLLPTLLVYDHESQSYLKWELSVTGDSVRKGNNVYDKWAVCVSNGDSGFSFATTDNVYYGNSGDTVYVTRLGSGICAGSNFRVKLNFDMGDADFIGGVNASDVQGTILYAFDSFGNYRPFNYTAADTYPDQQINVQDVVSTVNILLADTTTQISGGETGQQPSAAKAYASTQAAGTAELSLSDGKVTLYTPVPVAVAAIHMQGNVDWAFADYGLASAERDGSVVAYSLNRAMIPAGTHVIGSYRGGLQVRGVSLSDSEANAVSVTVTGNAATGIEDISVGDDGDAQIYDLNGCRQPSLRQGINIIRTKNGTIKRAIR